MSGGPFEPATYETAPDTEPSAAVPDDQRVVAVRQPAPVFALAGQARAGVDDEGLAALLVDHWDWELRSSPTWATTLGDHRNDDKLADNSLAGIERHRTERRRFLERARAVDPNGLSPRDRTTLALFVAGLEADVGTEVCEFELWSVSPRGNPVGQFNRLPESHKVESVEDGANLLARYRAVPGSVDNTIAALRAGAAKGLVANAETLRRTLAMVEGALAKPTDEWALLAPAAAERPGWAADARAEFARDLRAAVDDGIRPAYGRYRDQLKDLVARGRGPKAVGLGALPNGKACYEARLRAYTGLARTADEIHGIGTAEIDRINKEMVTLGRKLFKTRRLARIVRRLRTDKKLYFENKEQILAAAKVAVERARNTIGDWFGVLPRAPVVVVEIPDYEAPFTTIAYYRGPHADGSKPGEYFINTYKPGVRPRFEMEVLAYHEAIPGHHLQIAIAQERDQLPAFRRFSGNTAFVEGWALYTERLSREMGMYSGDLDVMGMLSYDAWRASRLVVDTGLHAKGWTRQQAERYMLEHTALTAANIANEVDRYISTPGQAVAYKTGQLEILRLRELARDKLGAAFDIKAFHDVVLGSGAVSLPVLERAVLDYIAAGTK